MEILFGKTMSSLLLAVRKGDATKIFLLRSRNFLLLNREVKAKDLENMDKKMRKIINRDLKIKRPLVECHHRSWRDRDLSCPSLLDREDGLTIRSFARMTLSENDKIQSVMRQFIEEERKLRKIKSDFNA
jgi:hypothetical protein